jgi:hypothetical protein
LNLREKARQSGREEILGIFEHLGARNYHFRHPRLELVRTKILLFAQKVFGQKPANWAIGI